MVATLYLYTMLKIHMSVIVIATLAIDGKGLQVVPDLSGN